MAERSTTQSELFDEEKIPSAGGDRPSRRTIDESGWWRAHFLVLASVFVGIVSLLVAYGVIWYWSSYDSVLFRITANLLGVLLWVVIFVFTASYFATLYGYYVEAKILKQSNADWQPTWWLYVIATPFLSAIPVSFIYLVNRQRHIGIRWGQLVFWR